ncbi:MULTISPECIES: sulfite exporter TauE/SafE family protein [Paenibacillus]|uniref:Probable membrane transporter protein n=1 Tax=Paenibacillus cucumis (ex Kampfer et al. 2016) TaxID=1776858 RepID=A0ABS7KG80_9BACL|nr:MULTISPECIES: sulfite exporter TauE/SafE family protein [Paenibacillus]MBY0203152.1 sulfite exporter TauE/SafE family protein [Paenibacillus cucumis (ex Kampfer et al. 2016)]MDP9697841.1 putative membrane protein YfcA [Paenibacillus intestini]
MLMVNIVLVMFLLGLLLGFVGAGGSGFIISILTVAFGYPIHVALGTALAAMFFSSLSGSISHYREGNAMLKTGVIVGLAGATGAWVSSGWSSYIPEDRLGMLTSFMLFASGLALWLRLILVSRRPAGSEIQTVVLGKGLRYWVYALLIGVVTGMLSGLFGIGSTPFIQLGLMLLLNMSMRYAAGTTMLVIIPIALAGGAGYMRIGYLDLQLLLLVVIGTMSGSYVGAKFTKRVPALWLKVSMVVTPMIGATILWL